MTGKERVQLTPGFVLHLRPWRETSALLEVFTETHGRVGLVARGVFVRMPGVAPQNRCIRVTAGTPAELDIFAAELPAALTAAG